MLPSTWAIISIYSEVGAVTVAVTLLCCVGETSHHHDLLHHGADTLATIGVVDGQVGRFAPNRVNATTAAMHADHGCPHCGTASVRCYLYHC